MRMKPSSMRKKARELPKPSNVRKKSKGTTKCEKKIVTCDVETAQYENGTVKCEKKIREPPNVRKNCHM